MGYDEVIVKLGDFGRYQKIIYILVCLTAVLCAFHKLAGVFLLASPDFRCALPSDALANSSYEISKEQWNANYPNDERCKYYETDGNGTKLTTTTTCSRYIYDKSQYLNSAVTEFDLVCARGYLPSTSKSMFMVGVLMGSIGFGHLSDKFGRKPIFFVALVMQLISGVIAAIVPDIYSFTLARMVVGGSTSGVYLVAYVIAMEMVGPSKRIYAGIFVMMCFSTGYMLTAAFAYFIHDWRWLQIALTLPGIFFMSYYWIIPESTRWLLSKGHKKRAIANIEKVAKFNKITLAQQTLSALLEDTPTKQEAQEGKQPSVLDLMRYPNLRRKTLLIFFDWFVNSGVYYGLSWNTDNLGDNKLLNYVISGAVEIPAYTFLIFTLNRLGRRTILCGSMLVAGTSLLLTIVVPTNLKWLLVVCAMIGKMAITSSYGTVYIFSAEQFPTVVRNVGLGASSMVARIGGILSPFCNELASIWQPLPLVIFGALAFAAGLLSLLLPETHNEPTLETIAEGEQFGQKGNNKGDQYMEIGGTELKETAEAKPLTDANGNGNKY